MKCLIIAAGKGSRLAMRGDSKPLVPLLEIASYRESNINCKGGGFI